MIGIVDYGMGNLRSLHNALDYLGIEAEVVTDPARIAELPRVIVPGVGAFARAMEHLDARGFSPALRAHATEGKPLLGICLGMQLLASTSAEFGAHDGLGLVPGKVEPFPSVAEFPVPHVGWNTLTVSRKHPLFAKVKRPVDYYFVHSFHFTTDDAADLIATTDYGIAFGAVVGRGSVVGCQFHPEKSQSGGLALLEGFSEWDGKC